MGYEIHINFAPVVPPIPEFMVYRKLRVSPQEKRPSPELKAHRLPGTQDDKTDWQSYWVATTPRDGFQLFSAEHGTNHELTRRMLFCALHQAAQTRLSPEEFQVPGKGFNEALHFVMERHGEGDELLVVEPYYLRAARQFGFLMDYHFRLAEGQVFDRRVQQLSLTLDKSFRRNLDYYVDRARKIRRFMEARWPVIGSLTLPGSDKSVAVSKEFVGLPASRLDSKTYVFSKDQESRGQFSGLRDHGPLASTPGSPTLLFIFREADRHAARRLVAALRGSRDRFGFPGFEILFKTSVDFDRNPIVVPDLTTASMQKALQEVRERRVANQSILPIVILPAGDDNGYLAHKALFSNAEIPTQVCTLRILDDEETMKWAIGNLGLQIFCKAGGQPWKVRPHASERSLIIGISQAHKVRRTGTDVQIDRYFAFSVLLDSSGVFEEIHVLGESEDETNYLGQLRAALREILDTSSESFDRVTIHTSFRLKGAEIAAIQETVREAAKDSAKGKCRFAVVKVNHRTRFFGVNRAVNSLVPYEASRVRLGPREYLMWFEGILPDKPTVSKAFPGPTHLQVMHVSEDQISDEELLQELVNLSGANWRGFNAKSAPVSVFYCHLVADLVRDFHDAGLPLPAVKDVRPWFL